MIEEDKAAAGDASAEPAEAPERDGGVLQPDVHPAKPDAADDPDDPDDGESPADDPDDSGESFADEGSGSEGQAGPEEGPDPEEEGAAEKAASNEPDSDGPASEGEPASDEEPPSEGGPDSDGESACGQEAASDEDPSPEDGAPPEEGPSPEDGPLSAGRPQAEPTGPALEPAAAAAAAAGDEPAAPAAVRRGAGKHSVPRAKKGHRALKIALASVAGVLAVACAVCGAWLWWDDSERTRFVPATTVLDGSVDLTGLTRDEAAEMVSRRVSYGYSPEVDLKISDTVYTIQLDDVGQVNVDATVARAFEPYTSKSLPERCVQRVRALLFGEEAHDYEVTTVCDVADSKLKDEIASIAKKADGKAVDAGYRYDEAKRVLVPVEAAVGVKVNKKKTFKAVKNALDGASTHIEVDGVAKLTKPGKTKAGQAIFVDTDSCQLYFYVDGKQKLKWPCSPGQSGYETPTGDWTLEYKDANPTWVNPHSPWSEGMAETIPASPSGPLGVRALAVSCGGGIFIHGTSKTWALGSRDSHGCVRLSNDNIVKLFDMVKVGIPIVIR